MCSPQTKQGRTKDMSSNQESIMFITTLVEAFRNNQISLTEMWEKIDQEMTCHNYAGICMGSALTCGCNQFTY